MHRDIPSYEQRFGYREIGLADLEKFGAAVKTRFGAEMHCAGVKAVEPQAFPQEFGATPKRFRRLFETHLASLRKYTFYFYPGKYDGKAPDTRVQFEMEVVRRSKFGDQDEAERGIRLGGLGCYAHDFEAFVKVAVQTLGLQKAPPVGMHWDDVAIRDRARLAIKNSDLADAISATLAARRYEEAMQSAVILVESKLRDKCVWAGKKDAQNATGSDLAKIAFHDEQGCLRPPWPVAAQAEQGAMLLFTGFFLYLRNAFGHNAVVMGGDKSGIFELLAFCEFLLMIIDKSTKR
jgi:hypothetical protein